MKIWKLIPALPQFLLACEKEETAAPAVTPNTCTTGTLYCHNASTNTVQRVLLSGTNYGSLDPGESRSFELAPGNWTLQFVGISGGPGCDESIFNIAACQTVSRACSH